MTWPQAVSAFAGCAFLFIWHQLHQEVQALRSWRHKQEATFPMVAASITTFQDRLEALERRIDRLEAV